MKDRQSQLLKDVSNTEIDKKDSVDAGKEHVKRKPRNKPVDGTYYPGSENRGTGNNENVDVLNVRAVKTGEKISMLVGKNMVPPGVDGDVMQEEINQESAQEVENFRPVEKIEYAINAEGEKTPVKGFTPGKTPLRKIMRMGQSQGIYFFSEEIAATQPQPPLIPSQPELNQNSAFYQSEAYKHIKKITDTIKCQQVTIDEKLDKEVKKERAQTGGKRTRSQHREMLESGPDSYGSATSYANATELFSESINVRWEWLHLVAHMILGARSQNDKNLVCGSEELNTWMLLAEKEIKYLKKEYPEGLTLNVSANLIKGTHIATSIKYEIITPDFKLPLDLNAFNVPRPNYHFSTLLHIFVKKMVQINKKKKEEKPVVANMGKRLRT